MIRITYEDLHQALGISKDLEIVSLSPSLIRESLDIVVRPVTEAGVQSLGEVHPGAAPLEIPYESFKN